MGLIDIVMFNAVIVSKHDMYEIEEGCLSLDGVRKTTRYQEIEVEYHDFNWKTAAETVWMDGTDLSA